MFFCGHRAIPRASIRLAKDPPRPPARRTQGLQHGARDLVQFRAKPAPVFLPKRIIEHAHLFGGL